MTKLEQDTILLAYYYSITGDMIKDAFDFPPTAFNNLEEAFLSLCEAYFGKDFLESWSPDES